MVTRAPADSRPLTAGDVGRGRTPLSTRSQPSRASARAMPRPMPRVPPVTERDADAYRLWTAIERQVGLRLSRAASRTAPLRARGSRPTGSIRRAACARLAGRDPTRSASDTPNAAAVPDARGPDSDTDRSRRTACRARASPACVYRDPSVAARSRKLPRRSSPCAPIAAAELSTGSRSLNGSDGRAPQSPSADEPGRAGVPVGHAVGARRRVDVEVAGGARGVEQQRLGASACARIRAASSGNSVARNSSCSAKPSIAHASPRVHVLNGE